MTKTYLKSIKPTGDEINLFSKKISEVLVPSSEQYGQKFIFTQVKEYEGEQEPLYVMLNKEEGNTR